MKTLIDTFRDFVDREQLFTKEDKLLLACSGGLDSTVLAHLLHAEGYDFAIAHMNFQLRGEASDGDAAFVEELARTLDAKFYCKAVDVKGEAEPGESTQMTARRLRYEWFLELNLHEYEFVYLITAHHLDDNFETILMNLIRGTGIKGIRGIQPKSFYKDATARPLLSSSRSDLETYAKAQNLHWREDVSNESDDYLRNRIRHHLTPVFFNKLGMSHQTLATTFANLRATEKFQEWGVGALFQKTCSEVGALLIVDRSFWTSSNDLFHFLHELINNQGLPSKYGNYTADQLLQVVTVPGNRVIEGNRCFVEASPEQLVFYPFARVENEVLPTYSIAQLPYINTLKHIAVHLELVSRPDTLSEGGVLYLAPPTLPLHLRPRQKGDRFQPLGMGGKTKKVKDYMINEKIPVWLRDRIYLLTNDQDEIMAITGYCISENFKVLPEHQEVLRISWG